MGIHCGSGSPLAARDAGIATVFQELSLIPGLSVASNLFYGIEPKCGPGGWTAAPSGGWHRPRRGTGGRRDRRGRNVRDLSLGERQVLQVCKALIRTPSVLILDGPTSALLPEQVQWLFEKVRAFAATGG